MMNKVHWIKETEKASHPRRARTFCGKYGSDDRCDEYITLDGREDRFEAYEDRQGVTCKACLKAGDLARARFE